MSWRRYRGTNYLAGNARNRANAVASASAHGMVLVGSDLITKLDAEVGGTVEVRGKDYEVVSIMDRTLTAPDQAVVMTLEDAQDIFTADMPAAVRDILDPRDVATSFAVYVGDGVDPDEMATTIEEEVADISAMGPRGFVEQVQEPLEVFNQIIYAVALLSLLIGGLSVINTMTMSVAERTREIGIRKAIGATDGAIMRQFIAESALLLGVLSRLLPARHAAKMNPVAALRYE